ncbi:hypothetical protein M9H77_21819 [Catharanthus roseus]|uniref:Uncharacterized protein n=1 Tax=Catharanthus roseus TaxID=4058 RepID=A0ACC0APF4_CATRO|nr:hypothetical protein M9H77_21819 [Catharanthus roseus]
MVSIGGTLGCTPSQHDIQQTFLVQPSHRRPREPVLDWGARGVKRGIHGFPGGGARGGRAPAPPDMGRGGHAYLGCGERGEGSGGRGRGDLGSSNPVDPFNNPDLDMPSFSLDKHDDDRTDMVTPAQQLGFGHRVGKKTTRFTPSNWP